MNFLETGLFCGLVVRLLLLRAIFPVTGVNGFVALRLINVTN